MQRREQEISEERPQFCRRGPCMPGLSWGLLRGKDQIDGVEIRVASRSTRAEYRLLHERRELRILPNLWLGQ